MHQEIIGFSGYENDCTINYYDSKGDYVKTYMLEKMEFELKTNKDGDYYVYLNAFDCLYFDELQKTGIKKIPKTHEISKIEKALCDCVDWESWYEKQSMNVDDFIPNDF